MRMNMNEFVEVVRDRLLEKMDGVTQIEIKQVLKNNSVNLCALLFADEKINITPNIYLEPFYERYEQGAELEDIVEQITECYQEYRVKEKIDMSFFRSWETVKSRIAYKLINYDRNTELLGQIPHTKFLDLAKTFYVSVQECGGSILIYNSHLEMWGVDEDELEAVANENTPDICPSCLQSMKDVVRELMGNMDDEGEEIPMGMLVLSNRNKVNGAAAILYPGNMQSIADRLQSDFYVLPSSVHETIILPAREGDNPEYLVEMVRGVNSSMVVEEEILGDNVYFYDRGLKELQLVA